MEEENEREKGGVWELKEILDEGLVRMSLNPCALLVPKVGIIRHQIPMIGGVIP